MHRLAPEYKSEILKQKSRLRINISEATYKTWHAKTMDIFEYIPEISRLTHRLEQICLSDESIKDKVSQSRNILESALELIESPLFGTGKETNVTHIPIPNSGLTFAPSVTQTNTLSQNVTVSLSDLLARVDRENVSEENKEEAKSHLRDFWDKFKEGVRDFGTIADIASKLAALGISAHNILQGLG